MAQELDVFGASLVLRMSAIEKTKSMRTIHLRPSPGERREGVSAQSDHRIWRCVPGVNTNLGLQPVSTSSQLCNLCNKWIQMDTTSLHKETMIYIKGQHQPPA